MPDPHVQHDPSAQHTHECIDPQATMVTFRFSALRREDLMGLGTTQCT